MLLVTRDCGWPDSLKTYEIYMPPGFELELGSRYFDFTNAIGEFSLIVRSRIYLDEISAVVMLTDQAMVTGDTLCVDELEVREDARVIQVDDGSCCGDPEIVQIPYRLHYTVPHQTITVP